MEKILQRIKEYRKKKGYSYDTMAHELNTSPAAYRKIELNQTKLTVERLYQIAQILEAKVEDILNIKTDKTYHQTNNDNAIGHQEIEDLYQENKEKSNKIEFLYEERIKEQAITIAQLMIVISNQKKYSD